MANKTCRKELNRQLQVLQARVKTLEKNVSGLNEATLTNIGQTAAAFIALIAEGMVTALPTYIANQLILKLAAAALGMAADDLENFPGMGAVGEFTSAMENIEDIIAEIMKVLMTPIIDWTQIQFKFMIPFINIPPYLGTMIDSALTAAESAVAAAQAALEADPLNAQLQAALTAAIDLRDSMGAAADAMNNLSACKIASSLLGG